MRKIIDNYKSFFDKESILHIATASLFLFISLVINHYSSIYATKKASNYVSDIILSNIRVYDVDFFFIYGSMIFWLFFAYLCLEDPKRIPFSFKTISLFVIIRSIFVSVTHIAPFPSQLVIQGSSKFFDLFTAGSDLFFSGHTGLPFLLALIFWEHKILRYIMLGTSVFFGVIVLMGHIHYTIDVFAAFFITYSIYRLAEIFFKTDRKRFYHGLKLNTK